jgi:hypothetical protein
MAAPVSAAELQTAISVSIRREGFMVNVPC